MGDNLGFVCCFDAVDTLSTMLQTVRVIAALHSVQVGWPVVMFPASASEAHVTVAVCGT